MWTLSLFRLAKDKSSMSPFSFLAKTSLLLELSYSDEEIYGLRSDPIFTGIDWMTVSLPCGMPATFSSS